MLNIKILFIKEKSKLCTAGKPLIPAAPPHSPLGVALLPFIPPARNTFNSYFFFVCLLVFSEEWKDA